MANTERAAKLRCAIYTRKSTEEGLEQEFNSLDAQREACAAYILSQKHEGWTALPTFYDDGGFPGGSMERPGLKALLADVEASNIDVVVVYKVDRLTRALADFARIVAIFDAAGVSFVSVTQAFNTTTSMGRLTLNVLLSFAQFEREVTAERIRDKIAASKRKGMWMGGTVPIGYRVEARKLLPQPEDAALVREIFERYLVLGTVPKLQAELERRGLRTPPRVSAGGRRTGGAVFLRGNLYTLLTNPVAIGRTRHGDQVYPGQHYAIIAASLWDQVQQRLAGNRKAHSNRATANVSSPLAGRMFDPEGNPMRPSHARKGGRRYRYYVSRDLMTRTVGAGATGWRIPALEMETAVAQAIIARLVDPEFASAAFAEGGHGAAAGSRLAEAFRQIEADLRDVVSETGRAALRQVVERIDVTEDRLSARIALGGADIAEIGGALHTVPSFTIVQPIVLARGGAELRVVLQGAAADARPPDATLIGAVVQARVRFTAWRDPGASATISQIAARHGADASDVSRELQLAFLAPDLVELILDGRQSSGLTTNRLRRIGDLPPLWDAQREVLS
jgi:DNA invertase Pin-like site-specific DNA recombinase